MVTTDHPSHAQEVLVPGAYPMLCMGLVLFILVLGVQPSSGVTNFFTRVDPCTPTSALPSTSNEEVVVDIVGHHAELVKTYAKEFPWLEYDNRTDFVFCTDCKKDEIKDLAPDGNKRNKWYHGNPVFTTFESQCQTHQQYHDRNPSVDDVPVGAKRSREPKDLAQWFDTLSREERARAKVVESPIVAYLEEDDDNSVDQ